VFSLRVSQPVALLGLTGTAWCKDLRWSLPQWRQKMKVRSLALFFSFVLLAGVILAHGDKKHVIGTIEKMGTDSLTVKTTEGSVDVKLVAGTAYVVVGADKVSKPAKVTDLHVGDRVVIHATPKPDNTLEAAEVRFSSGVATAASKPKP
jgi:hypothetical protein